MIEFIIGVTIAIAALLIWDSVRSLWRAHHPPPLEPINEDDPDFMEYLRRWKQ